MRRLVSCAMRAKQLIEVEDRRDLAADLGQRLERLGVEAALLEEPRVDERDRDVRGELAQRSRRRCG